MEEVGMHKGGPGKGVEEGCSFWCQQAIRSPGLQCQPYPILCDNDISRGYQSSVYSSHTLPLSHLIPGDMHHCTGIHLLCSNTSLINKVNSWFVPPKQCKEQKCHKILEVSFEGWFWYQHNLETWTTRSMLLPALPPTVANGSISKALVWNDAMYK